LEERWPKSDDLSVGEEIVEEGPYGLEGIGTSKVEENYAGRFYLTNLLP
jgi:hypothetical protein